MKRYLIFNTHFGSISFELNGIKEIIKTYIILKIHKTKFKIVKNLTEDFKNN